MSRCMATDMVDDITAAFGSKVKLHELDDGETARIRLRYMKSNRMDTEGVCVEFHFGSTDTVERVAEIVEDRLDKRKFKLSTDQPKYKQNETWNIGWVDLDNDGEIVDYEIEREYLKPSEHD